MAKGEEEVSEEERLPPFDQLSSRTFHSLFGNNTPATGDRSRSRKTVSASIKLRQG